MAEGVRYIRRDRRLLATVFLKAGVGILGANWVIFPIMGERIFPVHMAALDAARGALLGMSLLMTGRGIGALFGPIVASRWAGGSGARMRTGILVAFMAGAFGNTTLSAPTTT